MYCNICTSVYLRLYEVLYPEDQIVVFGLLLVLYIVLYVLVGPCVCIRFCTPGVSDRGVWSPSCTMYCTICTSGYLRLYEVLYPEDQIMVLVFFVYYVLYYMY